MEKTKYQTFTVNIPAGTPVGMFDREVILDNDYQKMTGINVIEMSVAPIPEYRIGLKLGDSVKQDLTHKSDYQSTTNVGFKERYKPVDFTARGNRLTVRFDLLGIPPADIIVDVVMKLENA